jgi:hypothetical protein
LLSGIDVEDIEQAAIPEWLAVELDMVAFVEVHLHASSLQSRISLRSPADVGLSIATRRNTEYPADIVEAAPLPVIKFFDALFPVQLGFILGPSRLLTMKVRMVADFLARAQQLRRCAGAAQEREPFHPQP